MPLSEYFVTGNVTPIGLDMLLEGGWRHFGEYFFRYDSQETGGENLHIVPLRINLERFKQSESQRRLVRKNKDLTVKIGPTFVDNEIRELFNKHKSRFSDNVPESLSDFLSFQPDSVPVENKTIVVFYEGNLIAASFLDIGSWSTSSIYGIFEPDFAARGLGIFTMLMEIQFSLKTGKKFYYPGYAHLEPSCYDYKKQFFGLERYDWESQHWIPAERFFSGSF